MLHLLHDHELLLIFLKYNNLYALKTLCLLECSRETNKIRCSKYEKQLYVLKITIRLAIYTHRGRFNLLQDNT